MGVTVSLCSIEDAREESRSVTSDGAAMRTRDEVSIMVIGNRASSLSSFGLHERADARLSGVSRLDWSGGNDKLWLRRDFLPFSSDKGHPGVPEPILGCL